MDIPVPGETLAFEGWRFETRGRNLLRQDPAGAWVPVQMSLRALSILALLLERPGVLVSKDSLMDEAWPNVAVAPNNLTVQMAALRRVLDEGRAGESCIQTLPGRGYRFALPVTRAVQVEANSAMSTSVVDRAAMPEPRIRRHWRWLAAGLGAAIMALVAVGWHADWFMDLPAGPRMSVAVLPLDSLDPDRHDSGLAHAITADLADGLAGEMQMTVVSAVAADAYKGRAANPREIGHALGVGYVVDGSVRQVGTTLRVDVQLNSTQSGRQVWSDQFNETLGEPDAAQHHVVARLHAGVRDALIQIESARSQREHPNDPDAFDLVVQARALSLRAPSAEQQKAVLALFERALAADPSYMPALFGSAYFLIEREDSWQTFADMRRAEFLSVKAREIAPKATEPAYVYMYWLKSVGRCPDVIELGHQFMQMGPDQAAKMLGIYSQLGQCLTQTGHAEEDITLQGMAIEADPSNPWMFWRYISIGRDQMLLGRDHDAITSVQRALALDANMGEGLSRLVLAAAYARTGQIDAARQTLAEVNRQSPYLTVRSVGSNYSTSPVYRAQVAQFQDALRLAGARDHADEDADFGVAPDGVLHRTVGRTPTTTPGAVTISTMDLRRLLEDDAKPIVIDAMTNWWGSSIPGAVGLKFAGLGGDFSDEAQDRLKVKMRELSGGDLEQPVVAVGWNSERFDGRNLALRLAALGYTHVYWYRGGREAWEVNGLPETVSDVQPW
jgi:adenylate cyclase